MIYALQIASVAFGLALVAMFNLTGQNRIKLLLAFSGAYLFSIVIIHFLPETVGHSSANVGLFVLGGFLLQILLDFYSSGLEHGHFHVDHFKQRVFPVGAIAGLYLHAIVEGLPIGIQHDNESAELFLLAIILHKVPITIVLYSLLYSLNLKRKTIWLGLGAFALASPLGTALGELIPNIEEYSAYLTAFAIGIFLHVSTTILFESSRNHRYNFAKIVVVVIGMVTAYLSVLFIGH